MLDTLNNRPEVHEFTAESMQRGIDNMKAQIEEFKKSGGKPVKENIYVLNKQQERFVRKWAKYFGIKVE